MNMKKPCVRNSTGAGLSGERYTYMYMFMHMCMYTCMYMKRPRAAEALRVQGGKDAQDALICRSLSAKEPPSVGLFCGK